MSIKEFENAFYHAHNCLPDVNKVDEYSRLTKSKRFIKNLCHLLSSPTSQHERFNIQSISNPVEVYTCISCVCHTCI